MVVVVGGGVGSAAAATVAAVFFGSAVVEFAEDDALALGRRSGFFRRLSVDCSASSASDLVAMDRVETMLCYLCSSIVIVVIGLAVVAMRRDHAA